MGFPPAKHPCHQEGLKKIHQEARQWSDPPELSKPLPSWPPQTEGLKQLLSFWPLAACAEKLLAAGTEAA